MTIPFNEHLSRIRTHLSYQLPGARAQITMAPVYRKDLTLASVDGKECREAGVLVLIFPVDGVATLLLTVRRSDLNQHAGQISFPGGRHEPGESLSETALREAHEETGLDPDSVEMLGPLTPLYVPPSNFCVYPFVGAVSHRPDLSPEQAEVEQILQVPMHHLLDPANRKEELRLLQGRSVSVPYFDIVGHKVWGATAMMLAEWIVIWT